jgi:hypothetical protein
MMSSRSDCPSKHVSAQADQKESSTAARDKEMHIPGFLKEDRRNDGTRHLILLTSERPRTHQPP